VGCEWVRLAPSVRAGSHELTPNERVRQTKERECEEESAAENRTFIDDFFLFSLSPCSLEFRDNEGSKEGP
jgi:hypothetical protein